MSGLFTLYYLRLHAISIVIKDDQCGLSVWDQLRHFYTLLCHPAVWCWTGYRRKNREAGQAILSKTIYSLLVVYLKQADEIYIRVTLDNHYILYAGPIPFLPSRLSPNILVATCRLCKMLPDRYNARPALFTRARNSRIVIFVNLKHIKTSVKVEIAECLDSLIALQRTSVLLMRSSVNPIRDVIFTKECKDDNTKNCKIRMDGFEVYNDKQLYRTFKTTTLIKANYPVNCTCCL